MANFELSEEADHDLTDIYVYTYKQFSPTQADSYLNSLDEIFLHLASYPRVGRHMGPGYPDYFRYEHASHVIFYQQQSTGIFIVRVLHNSMDPERHL